VSPDAPPAAIARRCIPGVKIAAKLGATLIVVLLDRERQRACCGRIARTIQEEVYKTASVPDEVAVEVVLKDRKFENWLIADLDALRAQPARFLVTNAIEQLVAPDKADKCDAESLIKRALRKSFSYDKTDDGFRVCIRMDVMKAAANSRSFRHLLHVLGCRPYAQSCARPVVENA